MKISNGINWQTYGHNKNKSLLEKQLALGCLPHAYLFFGPQGVGKKTLALEFAKSILGTENLNNHPDFQILDARGEIIIEAAKEFMSRLSLKPFVGEKKVAVINGAENLNQQSGNALLKTLEEPSPSTIIILIASGKLLPTIVSRCQALRFYGFSRGQLRGFGETSGLKVSEAMLDLSFGSPAKLRRLAEDADYFNRQKESAAQYEFLKSSGLGGRLAALGSLAEAETADLRGQLLDWLNFQTQELSQKPVDFAKARALMDADVALGMNKNKKLVLQTLMFKI